MKKKIIVPDYFQPVYDKWHYALAVESGGFVFVSGKTGTRDDGTNSDVPKEQFKQAFLNVKAALNAAALTFDDVVEMVTYHVGLQAHLDEFKEVKDRFVKAPYPAWTAVGVTELAVPGAIIEVKVTAKFDRP